MKKNSVRSKQTHFIQLVKRFVRTWIAPTWLRREACFNAFVSPETLGEPVSDIRGKQSASNRESPGFSRGECQVTWKWVGPAACRYHAPAPSRNPWTRATRKGPTDTHPRLREQCSQPVGGLAPPNASAYLSSVQQRAGSYQLPPAVLIRPGTREDPGAMQEMARGRSRRTQGRSNDRRRQWLESRMTSKESRPVWRGAEGKGVAKLPHRRPTRPPQPGLHPKPSAATMSYIEYIKFTVQGASWNPTLTFCGPFFDCEFVESMNV